MKKIISILLLVALVMGLAATSALAADDTTNYQFSFTAGCVDESIKSYGYSRYFQQKLSTQNYIEVRHSVPQSAAGFTNLIAAEKKDGLSIGAKWMASNSIYYSTNGGCKQFSYYAPCGRGNSKYSQQFGLTSITITGQFRVH